MAVTPAQLQAAIATAKANAVSPQDMVALIDYAIASQHFDASGNLILPITSAQADGVSYTITLERAQSLRAYYTGLISGGIVSQYVEFQNPSFGGVL